MLHCDSSVRWNVAGDLRFQAAISEPETPSLCGISGDLAPSTRKSLAIAMVRFWCAKPPTPEFLILVDISDFVFLLGGGEGGVRGARVRVGFLLKIPGGVVSQEGGRPRGWEGVCGEFLGGGGAIIIIIIFFSGPNARIP